MPGGSRSRIIVIARSENAVHAADNDEEGNQKTDAGEQRN
jgi:hypothetical protein